MKHDMTDEKIKLNKVASALAAPFDNEDYRNKFLHSSPSQNLVWYYNLSNSGLEIIISSQTASGCGSSLNTESIRVKEIASSKEGEYFLHITLTDPSDVDIFIRLILDLMDNSDSSQTSSQGISLVLERFGMWKSMLKHKGDSIGEAKGVIGELLTIIRLLECGIDSSIVVDSWVGLEKAQQDFVLPDLWIETKTVSSSATVVTINSLGQLDKPDGRGFLYVVVADSCSDTDSRDAICVEMLYNKICEMLENAPEAYLKFKKKMHDYEYDRFCLPDPGYYKILVEKVYEVKGRFPRLFNSAFMNGIKSVHYDLLLSYINNWIVNEGTSIWKQNV